MHRRKQIRDAVVVLVTGLPITGANVSGSKFYHLPRTVDEALRVYPKSEASDVPNMSKLKEHSFVLAVEAVVRRGIGNVEDVLDDVCTEVETALDGTALMAGVESVSLVGTNITFDGEGAKPIGAAEMLFQINYATREGLPEVIV